MSAHVNPGLDSWYTTTSSSDYKRHGAPVMGPWVEQLDPKLPGNGLLHRAGMPDVKVRIIWNTGCQLMSSGAAVCKAFVREMGPADLIRFRLPDGRQGRAHAHRTYATPRGGLTDNPHVIATEVAYKKAWLPVSYTDEKPSGLAGTWAQVTPANATVGLVHIPGIGSQQAYVLQVKNDAWGRPRALVQWRSMTSTKRQPNAGAPRAGGVVVTTARTSSTLRDILAPGSSQRVTHNITTTRTRDENPGGRPLDTQRGGRGAQIGTRPPSTSPAWYDWVRPLTAAVECHKVGSQWCCTTAAGDAVCSNPAVSVAATRAYLSNPSALASRASSQRRRGTGDQSQTLTVPPSRHGDWWHCPAPDKPCILIRGSGTNY